MIRSGLRLYIYFYIEYVCTFHKINLSFKIFFFYVWNFMNSAIKLYVKVQICLIYKRFALDICQNINLKRSLWNFYIAFYCEILRSYKYGLCILEWLLINVTSYTMGCCCWMYLICPWFWHCHICFYFWCSLWTKGKKTNYAWKNMNCIHLICVSVGTL